MSLSGDASCARLAPSPGSGLQQEQAEVFPSSRPGCRRNGLAVVALRSSAGPSLSPLCALGAQGTEGGCFPCRRDNPSQHVAGGNVLDCAHFVTVAPRGTCFAPSCFLVSRDAPRGWSSERLRGVLAGTQPSCGLQFQPSSVSF